MEVTWEELLRLRGSRYREAFRAVQSARLRGERGGGRGLREALRLALLAREAARLCIEVVEWDGERVLRLVC